MGDTADVPGSENYKLLQHGEEEWAGVAAGTLHTTAQAMWDNLKSSTDEAGLKSLLYEVPRKALKTDGVWSRRCN